MNTYKIKDVIYKLYDGPHATPKPTDKGPIFLGINNLTDDGKLDLSTIRHIDEAEFPKWTKRVVPKLGDIVFTYEATLNRYAMIPKNFHGCLGRRLALIRTDDNKVNNKFLFYYFFTNEWRNEIQKHLLSGSTVDRIPLTDFPDFELRLPNKLTQDKVASILSTYDELIEKNEKRIRVLEETTRRLYAEWFVYFKFPDYKIVRMVNGLPEGWEYKRMDAIARVIRGTSYSTEQINETYGDYYLVNLKSFNRGGGFRHNGEKYFSGKINKEQLLTQGDIVVAVTDMTTDRAVIARPARIPRIKNENITFSADVVKILPEKLPATFIYYSLLDYRFTETTKNKANGANVLHLKPQAISEYKILIPTSDLFEKFEKKSIGIVDLIDKLSERNEKLTKMRDLLIPQLLTGARELKNYD